MSAAGARRVALLLAGALLVAACALWWRWGAAVFVSGPKAAAATKAKPAKKNIWNAVTPSPVPCTAA
jgi:hypothetical protein